MARWTVRSGWIVRGVLFVSLFLATSADWCRAQSPGPTEPPKTFDLAAIDAYVAAQVRDEGYAGLSLTIMREGKVVMAKGYGKRLLEEGAPVEPETPFAVGSVTKQFTCACILLLAEDGKLSIDDKVAKYEPKLTRAGDITLHDLMTHMSGYPDFYPLDFVDRRLVKPILPEALLAEYAGAKLDFEPGERWSYSNTGYTLLGRRRRQGQRQAVRAVPQGADSRSAGHDAFRLRAGTGNEGTNEGLHVVCPGAAGARGARGQRLAVRRGGPVGLRPGPCALGPRPDGGPRAKARVVPPHDHAASTQERTNHGLWLRPECPPDRRRNRLTHGGAVSGFLSVNAMVPRTKSAVILLTNTEHLPADSLHSTILRLLLEDRKKQGPSHVPKVNGPPPKEAALDFLHQMQAGKVDRDKLGEEFGAVPDRANVCKRRRRG